LLIKKAISIRGYEVTIEEKIRLDNPWPDIESMKDVERIQLSLDGGGREIIDKLIKKNNIKSFVEVGAFLCGSTRRWLECSSDLTVYCVDIWGANLKVFIEALISIYPDWLKSQVDQDQLRKLIDYFDKYGVKEVALNNIKEYKDRVIPIQRGAPDVYEYLSSCGLKPDAIYIDARKEWQEFIGAHESFPDTILCGDDWTWKGPKGDYPVREYVYKIAEMRNKKVISKQATWLIEP
jgi:hypothetical protein